MTLLDELIDRIEGMSEADKAAAWEIADETASIKWIPNPGPQSDAYFSDADVLLYGGSGGGGKTDQILGLAFNCHQRSLIMRRQYTDLSAMTERAIEINGTRTGYSGSSPPRLKTSDGRLIEFGAAKDIGDEAHWQGQPHDALFIDEAVQFAESQIRFLMGWVRTTIPGQRTRVVFATNPPLSEEGMWIINMFAPWLDPAHPNPARPGELRWYITDHSGMDKEVDGPGKYAVEDDEGIAVLDPDGVQRSVQAMSRTFIPASVHDNPYLKNTDYVARLDALPEPLRSAIRDGNFMDARQDHDLQLIPYDWISAAQARWSRSPPNDAPMCAMGIDVTGGGSDKFVIAPRYDFWYGELIVQPGDKLPLGTDMAAFILKHRRDQARPIIDCGGGYGNAPAEHLEINGVDVTRYLGAGKSSQRTKKGGLAYHNKRAEAYYRFYEALDPDQPGGSSICLPHDPELLSDLCSIRLYSDDLMVIRLEPKTKLIKRLGRSTDRGDAVVMAWADGPKRETHHKVWRAMAAPPVVKHGHANMRIKLRR